MVTTRDIVVGTAAAAAVCGIGYLIYFDQKRQRDPAFRRKLKKQRKEVAHAKEADAAEARLRQRAAAAAASAPGGGIDLDEPIPTSPQERGEYFMKHLQMGEALLARGPQAYDVAAKCFFKALQAYAEPMNLLMVLQQSVPEPVLNTIMELYAADVDFNHFPPQSMNVKVKEVQQGTTPEGKRIVRRGLSVTKDVAVGEKIYRERPIVSTQYLTNGNLCGYCLKPLDRADRVIPCENCTEENYCCDSCRESARKEFHGFLCTADPTTGEAYKKLLEHCSEKHTKLPLLVANFLAKMVYEETVKPEEGAEKPKYSTWDHLERLYDLKLKPTEEDQQEVALIKQVIGNKVPGFDDFLTEDRYVLIKGKTSYNAYAVATGSRATPVLNSDPVRGAFAVDQKTGVGLYHATSLIAHSCDPNVDIQYQDATNELTLVAKTGLKAEDELYISYIIPDGKETKERRKELKEKYSFHCKCTKCTGSMDILAEGGAGNDETLDVVQMTSVTAMVNDDESVDVTATQVTTVVDSTSTFLGEDGVSLETEITTVEGDGTSVVLKTTELAVLETVDESSPGLV
ncbi:hypothetical protein SpCBS45565_g03542 [Spizellomyces sp. 'palustris']|nr:hypothetical protein SpCBS45565_g03542 [Spizellomyces sp. 'palustris']